MIHVNLVKNSPYEIYEISLYGQENSRGTKKVLPPHPAQVPVWHHTCVSVTRPNLVPTLSKAPPHSSSTRQVLLPVPLLQTFYLVFPLRLGVRFSSEAEQSCLRFIHSVTDLLHSSLSLGGRRLHQWEGHCVSHLRAGVICLCEKVHLLLMRNVWNSLKDRSPAFLSDWSVSVDVFMLDWRECICCTVRKCT